MASFAPPTDVTVDAVQVARFIELVPVPVTLLDERGNSLHANRAFCEAVDLPAEVVLSRPIEIAIHPHDVARAERALAEALTDASSAADLRLLHNDGEYRSFRWDMLFHSGIGRIVAIASDRTSERERLAEAQRRAVTDALTGLLSRAGLIQEVQHLCNYHPDGGVVLALVDVDDFKGINDSLGHEVGDSVLCDVARRLRRAAPEASSVGRLGGDEFVVVTSARTMSASLLGAAITDAFQLPLERPGRSLDVRVSVGLSESTGEETVDHLLRNADVAVYQAKRIGGNQACHASDELVEEWERQRALARELESALGTGVFVPHYQPIVDLDDGSVVAHEVLLRWRQNDGTVVPAGVFLDVASNAGLLPSMSTEIRNAAIAEIGVRDDVRITVNVSADELLDDDFGPDLVSAVRASGTEPCHVIVEITEQTALRDLDRAANVLGRLREIGFKVALDDFGSGYSSLTYLTQLPIDVVKLDRHFVRSAQEGDEGRRMLAALTTFLRQIDLRILIEGVETETDHALVRELGVDYGQGWFYGRPGPLD